MDNHSPANVWKGAWAFWNRTGAGPHPSSQELEQYVRGSLANDPKTVVRVRRHLARCDDCLRKESALREPRRVLVFLPRRIKVIGEAASTSALAAGHAQASTYESLQDADARADLLVSEADELFVTVTERGQPLMGWLVRLERVDRTEAILQEERSETTDAMGRVSLGTLRGLRPRDPDQRFRVSVIAPGE